MDQESDRELVGKFFSTQKIADDNMIKWFGEAKIIERIEVQLKWYSAVLKKF